MLWFWVALIIGCAVMELSTLKMFFGMLALGAGSSALAKLILPSIAIGWQVLIFLLVDAFLFFVVRPFIKKAIAKYKKKSETNNKK